MERAWLGISVLAPWVLVLAGTQWEPLVNSAMLDSDHSVMAHNRHRGEGRDAEPLTGSSIPAELSTGPIGVPLNPCFATM